MKFINKVLQVGVVRKENFIQSDWSFQESSTRVDGSFMKIYFHFNSLGNASLPKNLNWTKSLWIHVWKIQKICIQPVCFQTKQILACLKFWHKRSKKIREINSTSLILFFIDQTNLISLHPLLASCFCQAFALFAFEVDKAKSNRKTLSNEAFFIATLLLLRLAYWVHSYRQFVAQVVIINHRRIIWQRFLVNVHDWRWKCG